MTVEFITALFSEVDEQLRYRQPVMVPTLANLPEWPAPHYAPAHR